MVTLVPFSRKSISLSGSVTLCKLAKVRVQSMVVHSVGLSLVAKQTSIGRKPGLLAVSAFCIFAAVWPQMGIQVFTVRGIIRGGLGNIWCILHLLVDAPLAGGLVVACSRGFVRAMEFSILGGLDIIERVTPGLGFDFVNLFIFDGPGIDRNLVVI